MASSLLLFAAERFGNHIWAEIHRPLPADSHTQVHFGKLYDDGRACHHEQDVREFVAANADKIRAMAADGGAVLEGIEGND